MKSILTFSLIIYIVAFTPMFPANLVTSNSSVAFATQQYDAGDLFSQEQLENLLAPIALYPDPLLAQVLVAATFPGQIDEAASFLSANADPEAIDYQPWDVSVKAVAHYPTVLYMMADSLDWTATLGQAYVSQSTAVMMAVQRLRHYARTSGSLVSTAQMAVVEEAGYIMLWPVHPRYLYVPVYDPAIVFLNRGYYGPRSVISFGLGFAIGSWLNYDFDWHHRRVYYHGWAPRAGWVHRYRPRIHRTNIYVHNRYNHVTVNRPVLNRWVNYRGLNRYNAVHRRGNYNNVRVHRPRFESRVKPRAIHGERRVNNKIIRRNIDLRDTRIDANRDRYQERRVERIGPGKSIKRGQVKNRHERSRPGKSIKRERINERHVRIEPEKSFKRERVKKRHERSRPEKSIKRERVKNSHEGSGPGKSIKRERVKKRHEYQANKLMMAQVRRRMEKNNTSAFRERQTAIDSRAASKQGRTNREQMKQRTVKERSPERSANAPADRRDGGRRPRDNRQR